MALLIEEHFLLSKHRISSVVTLDEKKIIATMIQMNLCPFIFELSNSKVATP